MIIPALLTTNIRIAAERVDLAKRMSGWLHVDVLDNSLYSFTSMSFEELNNLDFSDLSLEWHSMTNSPSAVLDAGLPCDRVILHVEARNWAEEYSKLSSQGIDTWLAVSPETDMDDISLPEDLAGLVIMGVTPGQSGQALDEQIFARIENIKERYLDLPITVDGGVKEANIRDFIAVGVDNVVMGSGLFEEKDPVGTYERLAALSDPIHGQKILSS